MLRVARPNKVLQPCVEGLGCRSRQLRRHLVMNAGHAQAAVRHVPDLRQRAQVRICVWDRTRPPAIGEHQGVDGHAGGEGEGAVLTSTRDATVRAPKEVVVLMMCSLAPLNEYMVSTDRRSRRARKGRRGTDSGAGAWKVVMIVCETKSEGLPCTIPRNARPTEEHLGVCVHVSPRCSGDVGEHGRKPARGNSHVNEECGAAAVQRVLAVEHVCVRD